MTSEGEPYLGALLQPPRLCALDIPDAAVPGADKAVRSALLDRGLKPCWSTRVDDVEIVLTHTGGVFVRMLEGWQITDQADFDRARERTADLCNLVLCELTLQAEPCMPFTIADICHAHTEADGSIAIWVAPGVYAPVSMTLQGAARTASSETSHWARVSASKVKAIDDLGGARHLRDIAEPLPAFVTGALGSAARQRGAETLLFSWMVCEQLLNWLWDTHVVSDAHDSRHRTRLKDGRTFTAAVQAEALRLQGVIDDETYRALTTARGARNDLAHGARIRPATVEIALRALNSMLVLEYETAEERAARRRKAD